MMLKIMRICIEIIMLLKLVVVQFLEKIVGVKFLKNSVRQKQKEPLTSGVIKSIFRIVPGNLGLHLVLLCGKDYNRIVGFKYFFLLYLLSSFCSLSSHDPHHPRPAPAAPTA
jgi:hypothetical protein